MKEKRQGNADSARQNDTRNGDEKAIAERLAARRGREETDVGSQGECPARKEAADKCEGIGVEDASDQDKQDEKRDHDAKMT